MLGTDMVKGERIDELEEITTETIKNKTQGKKRLKKKWTEHEWAVGQLKVAYYMNNWSHQSRRQNKIFEEIRAGIFPYLMKIR